MISAHRPRRPRPLARRSAALGAALLLLAGCGGDGGGAGDGSESAAADDRGTEQLYEEAFTPPEGLDVLSIPEGAARPTVSAVHPGDDVGPVLDDIEAALEDAGWEVQSRSGTDATSGGIVAVRGDEDLQVEAMAGDVSVSVTFIFAAPGEGL